MVIITDKDDPRLKLIINRADADNSAYLAKTAEIVETVRKEGDAALYRYSELFDGFKPDRFEIEKTALRSAYDGIDPALKEALTAAHKRITDFHILQKEKSWFITSEDGSVLGQKVTPLARAGVYVPGGKAAYPSSVLMNVIPAKVAGVAEICMATPAVSGKLNQAVLAAAYISGVDRVFQLGGAQAIAAFAYGTESVPRTDKITGPGNIYVALAKKLVFGVVDIDMVAGPSEVLIIADETANHKLVAADMLAQAEHDELAGAYAIVSSFERAKELEEEINIQIANSHRKEIIEKSINNRAAIIVAPSFSEAAELANTIAPEHLELHVASPLEKLKHVKNAGAVFLGEYSPEAAGDYAAGPNHVLPTGGSARFASPLGVYDFIKRTSVIYCTKEGLAAQKDSISTLAKAEGLAAHYNSLKIREV
jgi:histidinol dehydrogenase